MSNNKKYIVLPGGKECKLKSPHTCYEMSTYRCYELPDCPLCKGCVADIEFDKTAPTYTLTEVMPEGVEFDGVEVWQILYGRTKWVTDVEKRFDTFLEFREYWFDRATRIAIKPLKAIEPEKALKNLKN